MAKRRGDVSARQAKQLSDAKQVIARNRRAGHDYFLEEKYEAGLVLSGTEVKSLRMGRASLNEAWVEFDRSEAWLHQAHIPTYINGTWTNHAPLRKRKLLLHRKEITKLERETQAKGYTVVPLELYFIRGRVKVEIALARGKQEWDKRQTLREQQDKRESQRELKSYLKNRS